MFDLYYRQFPPWCGEGESKCQEVKFQCDGNLRLIDLKCHIDYFSKGPKSNRTDRTQKRRSFRVNSMLSFHHNDKHEMQHVGQLISIKGHIIE